jgi:hypothetical protein
MPEMAPKCQDCKTATATVFISPHTGDRIKRGRCQACYDEAVRQICEKAKRQVHTQTRFENPGRDPDHDHIDIDAQRWFEHQMDLWDDV